MNPCDFTPAIVKRTCYRPLGDQDASTRAVPESLTRYSRRGSSKQCDSESHCAYGCFPTVIIITALPAFAPAGFQSEIKLVHVIERIVTSLIRLFFVKGGVPIRLFLVPFGLWSRLRPGAFVAAFRQRSENTGGWPVHTILNLPGYTLYTVPYAQKHLLKLHPE